MRRFSSMPRALRLACWVLCLVIPGLDAFANRYTMNPDGLSYLDVSRAFLVLDFERAINAYWSPLYPSFLAVGFRLAPPSAAWLIPMVHAVNFVIFLGVLAAFEFFLRGLLRFRQRDAAEGPPAISDSVLVMFAYAVFVYSTVALIGLQLVTPDLCVAAAVFAAAGLFLAMTRRGPVWTPTLGLGLVLGLGYLAKSVMFVLGLVFIISLPLSPALRPQLWRHWAVVAGVFGAIATLLIIPISRKTGGLTFGTSGKLTYAFMVNRVPYTNWQAEQGSAGPGFLRSPTRLGSDPKIFEFTDHLSGTYPPWFDPTYWTSGLRAEFDASNQVRALTRTGGFYVNIFLGGAGVAATLLLALTWLCADNVKVGRSLRELLPLFVLALAGLAIYLPINVESRYIAAFAGLLWILPVAAARRLESAERVQWLDRAGLACAACLVIPVTLHAVSDAWDSRHEIDPHPRVAANLSGLGLRPGDGVANIGIDPRENTGSSFEAFWAYMAQLQIVAEIPAGGDFLCSDELTRKRVYAELARVGARAVVTLAMPTRLCAEGWEKVEGTDYYVRLLDQTSPS